MRDIQHQVGGRRIACLGCERLESRDLLAVDLVVEQTTARPSVEVGQEITYKIEITNNGPDAAIGARIVDPVTERLDNVTWTRDVEFSVGAENLNGLNGFHMTGTGSAGSKVSTIGDVNGDGFADFAIVANNAAGPNGELRAGRIYVVFGQAGSFEKEIDLDKLGTPEGVDGKILFVSLNDNQRNSASIHQLGDVNADGIDDFLVHSRADFAGTSHVVFGASDFGQSGDILLSQLDGSVGFSVPTVFPNQDPGDVNGDGVNDLLFGETFGDVFVVFGRQDIGNSGSIDLPTEAGLRLTGGSRPSITIADANGDGIDDIGVLTQPDRSNGDAYSGFVIYGSKDFGSTRELDFNNLEPNQGGVYFTLKSSDPARRIVNLGDINDDGNEDFSVLALPMDFWIGPRPFVVLNKPEPPAQPTSLDRLNSENAFKLSGISFDHTGYRRINSISGAGDVNGDGIGDFVVGVPVFSADNNLSIPPNPGSTYVVFGGAELNLVRGALNVPLTAASRGTTFLGSLPSDSGGKSVSSAGDVNGDGLDDVLIGAAGAYLVYGRGSDEDDGAGVGDINESIDVFVGDTITYEVTGTVKSGFDGQFITAAQVTPAENQEELDPPTNTIPNVPPGTLVDLKVTLEELPERLDPGQPISYELLIKNEGPSDAVNASIQHSLPAGIQNPTWVRRLDAEVDLKNLSPAVGFKISEYEPRAAGDLNGDGIEDVAFKSLDHDTAHIVFGPVDLSGEIDFDTLPMGTGFVASGTDSKILLGADTKNGIGDFNGDGLDDVLFLVQNSTGAFVPTVLFGSRDLVNLQEVALDDLGERGTTIIHSEVQRTRWSVSNAGDMNGDGRTDLLVSRESGDSYVVFGSATTMIDLANLDGTNGFQVNVPKSVGGFAFAVGGDINGDGFSDIVAVHPWVSINILLGKSGIGSQGNVHLDNVNAHGGITIARDNGGASLSISGDVNGDGFDDIAIGGLASVNVYFGSDNPADIFQSSRWISSDVPDNWYNSLTPSFVGDFNADGFDDVLVSPAEEDVFKRKYNYVLYGAPDFGEKSRILENYAGDLGILLRNKLSSALSIGDVNSDGIDDFRFGRDVLFGLNKNGSGTGDITDSVDIPAGTTIRYSITGTGSGPGSSRFELEAIAAPGGGQLEYRPSNNTVGVPRANPVVDLQVSVSERSTTKVEANEPVSFTFEVSNLGPNDAKSAMVVGAFENLTDIQWSEASANETPSNIDLTQLGPHQVFQLNGSERGQLGRSTMPVGDLNADGFGDLLVRNNFEAGIVFGGNDADMQTVDISSLDGQDGFALQNFGAHAVSLSISPAGDVNGDGMDDVIIGARIATVDESEFAGSAFVLFGNSSIGSSGNLDLSTLDGKSGFVVSSPYTNLLGDVTAGGEDINGDGLDDIVVGSSNRFRDPDRRDMIVIFGSPAIGAGGRFDPETIDGSNGFVVRDKTRSVGTQDWVLSSVGDITGDGLGDIVFSDSEFFDGTGAIVVFGMQEPPPGGILDVSDLDGTNGFQFDREIRFSVAGADLNGDEINDLIYTDWQSRNPNGVLGAGQIIVRLGGPNIVGAALVELAPAATDFVIQGTRPSESIGRSLARLDFNADGIDDVVASSQFGVFVVFGQTTFGAGEAFRTDSLDGRNGFGIERVNDEFWHSFASAGDFNGDGIDDFLTNDTNANPNGIEDAGTTYVLYGRRNAGSGMLNQLVDIPSGGTVTYSVSGRPLEDAENVSARLEVEHFDDSVADNNIALVDRAVLSLSDIDLDGSGLIDFQDFLILADNFGQQGDQPEEGDINGNGQVDFLDFLVLAKNSGRQL